MFAVLYVERHTLCITDVAQTSACSVCVYRTLTLLYSGPAVSGETDLQNLLSGMS